jgi:manganese/zinc/iron transport system substrate-binding protein
MHVSMTRRNLLVSGAATLGVLAVSVGLANQNRVTDSGDRIAIATTVGMITDVVRNIGGEEVAVSGLMGPGVDPHTYKPRASDITTLGDADLIFYGGLSLEGRMIETFEKIDDGGVIPTIPVSENIPENLRIANAGGHYAWDPHVWFDVSLWTIVVEGIAESLIEHYPLFEAGFAANMDAYRTQLDELDAWVFEQVKRLPPEQRVLITAHDAFTYFGRRYGFEVLGVQGISTASEAGAGDIQDLAGYIAANQIRAIFVESAVPPSTIEAVQAAVRAQGWDVQIGGSLYADAFGKEGTPDGTYIGMVRANVTTIVEALLGTADGTEDEEDA